MAVVKGFIWDDWNREHLARHGITPDEVEEVCHRKHKLVESYRKRILIVGQTKQGKTIAIVLSPEDRSGARYDKGFYYPITSFRKE